MPESRTVLRPVKASKPCSGGILYERSIYYHLKNKKSSVRVRAQVELWEEALREHEFYGVLAGLSRARRLTGDEDSGT